MAAIRARRRILLLTALVGVALVASTSLAAAAPFMSHGAGRGGAPSGPAPWPTNGSRYDLLFSETGLPTGANWSVQLGLGGLGWRYDSNESNTSSIGFLVRNGTIGFSIGTVAPSAGRLYVPSPAIGNVTVNGTNVTVDVTFAAVPLFDLSFVETGLPAGTWWFAEIHGAPFGAQFNSSSGSTIGFAVPNGTYEFTIGTSEFHASPAVLGPLWNNTTVNGSAPGQPYVPTPSSGSVAVSGANASVSVEFAPLAYYTVTFVETGLPNGTSWSVGLSGSFVGWDQLGYSPAATSPACSGIGGWNGSANDTIEFTLPDGTYGFEIGNVTTSGAIYVPNPSNGSVTVNGTNATVNVEFTAVPLYALTFTESGLPNGTWWYVAIYDSSTGGSFNASTGPSIGFEVPNGTYAFSVGTASPWASPEAIAPLWNNTSAGGPPFGGAYTATPGSGNASVDGTNVVVNITFAPPTLYTVTFEESGLPNGTSWSVAIYASGPSGFGSPAATSGVLPACGPSPIGNGSDNSSLGFVVPNGTYLYAVSNAWTSNGTYVPAPSSGNVTVNGSNVLVSVTFAPLAYYTVSFHETGLPNGTAWWVGLYGDRSGGWDPVVAAGVSPLCGGPTPGNGSTNSSIEFSVPDGTYGFYVGTVNSSNVTYVPTPQAGNVTVDGSAVTIDITFAVSESPIAPAAHDGSVGGPVRLAGIALSGSAVIDVVGLVALLGGALALFGLRRSK